MDLPIEITPKTLFVSNHSGGKDSQVMYEKLSGIIPREQLIVIHSHLPGVEWPGIVEHIENTVNHEIFVVQAVKTFFQMVDHRKKWPSPSTRQCTSDLKRGPIKKKIIEICNSRGFDIVVNCMGLRAEESSSRAKKQPFKLSEKNSNGKRLWYEWLPIHKLKTSEVFQYIKDSGKEPHWAYKEGMSRLSCCFCIMSSEKDLKTAARLQPDLLQKYVEKERELNHTLLMPGKSGPRFLSEIIN